MQLRVTLSITRPTDLHITKDALLPHKKAKQKCLLYAWITNKTPHHTGINNVIFVPCPQHPESPQNKG